LYNGWDSGTFGGRRHAFTKHVIDATLETVLVRQPLVDLTASDKFVEPLSDHIIPNRRQHHLEQLARRHSAEDLDLNDVVSLGSLHYFSFVSRVEDVGYALDLVPGTDLVLRYTARLNLTTFDIMLAIAA